MVEKLKKVLVIGSGPIVIGQAAEFDYAGVQTCRALKQENIKIILVNSNPATIMTDENIADKVYIEPLTKEVIEKIIEKEKPEGILATFGGQTGLNLLYELDKADILTKNNVKILGTSAEAVKNAEDRDLFKTLMQKNSIPVLNSSTVSNFEDAEKFVKENGFPIVIRPAYTLGGEGGAFIDNIEQFNIALKKALKASLINQVLLEQSVEGYKEIEYEIVRDCAGNVIEVCDMENIDPMGIHTGDSMVAAPCQTLSNTLLKNLKETSFKIAENLNIIGSCNIQYAVNPNDEKDFYVIEVNPRVSRSSALASKATGFPIAKVATKLALGYKLTDFSKNIEELEPKLDYVVVKVPKWSFDKFKNVDKTLTTQMKSTGEVMALGKTFEEAFYKALKATENREKSVNDDVSIKDDLRIYRIFEALKNGKTIEQISNITNIDKFFIDAFKNILNTKYDTKHLNYYPVTPYCDSENTKQAYFYSSIKEEKNKFETKQEKEKILIIGSGPIRIGQGIEFDYCCVHCVNEIKKSGYEAILINSNPETLSTDYDIATRLYFEPLTYDFVKSVIDFEKPKGVIIQFGGQTAINIAEKLKKDNINILGTTLESLNKTEDREAFSSLLYKLNIPQAKGYGVISVNEAMQASEQLNFPLLVRPSYTIGGLGVKFVKTKEELKQIVESALLITNNHAMLIDEYIEGIEAEADVICDGEDILMAGILEHIEKTGVHSGDSIAIYPAQRIFEKQKQTMFEYAQKISKELNLKGLMNIQYILKDDKIYVLEVNPRASRTVPILSKITGIDLCKTAVDIMIGKSLKEQGFCSGISEEKSLYAVKIPVFNISKLPNADNSLTTEMKSTGEVLGVDKELENAAKKAFVMSKTKLEDIVNSDTKKFFNKIKNTERYNVKTITDYRNDY